MIFIKLYSIKVNYWYWLKSVLISSSSTTNKYPLNYVLPWKLAEIFYAEYGAWADREYMISSNYWSRLIEGSHAGLCGLFSLLGMLCRLEHVNKQYLVCMVLAMGTQLMNSVLYMGEYFFKLVILIMLIMIIIIFQ